MPKKFKISFSSTTKEKRPPVSYKLREYYESFLEENLYSNPGIKINDKWSVMLSIIFVEEGPRFTTTEISLLKSPRTVKEENVKIYEVMLPLKRILADNDILNNTIRDLQESITMLVTQIYKKLTVEVMNEIWKKVDVNYLKSLPFPAPLNEQRYAGDILRSDGSVGSYM